MDGKTSCSVANLDTKGGASGCSRVSTLGVKSKTTTQGMPKKESQTTKTTSQKETIRIGVEKIQINRVIHLLGKENPAKTNEGAANTCDLCKEIQTKEGANAIEYFGLMDESIQALVK